MFCCRGEGTLPKNEEVKIKIPGGIEDGQMIKLSGQGEADRRRTRRFIRENPRKAASTFQERRK